MRRLEGSSRCIAEVCSAQETAEIQHNEDYKQNTARVKRIKSSQTLTVVSHHMA